MDVIEVRFNFGSPFVSGGMLILEPQDFESYKKKKKLTERIFENFQNIKLRPEQFADYLLQEVGFCSGYTIAKPQHPTKGFQRPIYVSVTIQVMRVG